MLERLAAADDPAGRSTVVHGDMVDDLPDGPFDVVLAAYNTLFNLVDDGAPARAASRPSPNAWRPGGSFVVEAFVPDAAADHRPDRARRSRCDRWASTTSCSRCRATTRASRRAEGQFVEFTESGGVRLRPWTIRWATPGELDAMAAAAGLSLAERWADMAMTPFTDDSPHHVSVYRTAFS